jgi:hypothetical protein
MVCGPGEIDNFMKNGLEKAEPQIISTSGREKMAFVGCRLMVEMAINKELPQNKEMRGFSADLYVKFCCL